MTRVAIIGKNRLAAECLDVVVRAGDEVVVAVADADDNGIETWQASFRRAAERAGVPVASPRNVNDDAFVAELASMEPDFILSFQAAQILRRPLLEVARVAALNLHYGPLPRYRGVAPIAWAIINGELETGVTIHHIDPGIDSGAVITSRAVAIDRADTGRSLYDKCTTAGIELFSETWKTLRTGSLDAEAQSSSEVLYYNRHSIDFSRRTIDWRADAEALFNWIRAYIFPPFQHPVVRLGGHEYEIAGVDADRRPHRGWPGEILAVDDATVVVAAPGGRIVLGPIMSAGSHLESRGLASAGFEVGARLADD